VLIGVLVVKNSDRASSSGGMDDKNDKKDKNVHSSLFTAQTTRFNQHDITKKPFSHRPLP
jgi:hypothetical protein